jgi:hypothetical protein
MWPKMTVYNVLNLGAGLQSSRVLLGACRGELPKFDVAIFADTQWEPEAVYRNVEFLRGEAEMAGIQFVVRTAGNLREDAVEFRRSRKSSDGKRFASIPTFIENPDGTQGQVRRQCTSEYKIAVVDKFIRRELLTLQPKSRVPKGVVVRQWFGISSDESGRATFPGVFKEKKVGIGRDLFGNPRTIKVKTWMPRKWGEHIYPLLGQERLPNRKIRWVSHLPKQESRADCGAWLKLNYPRRPFPRSACIGCPFRSNDEWKRMRDETPDEWDDACDFDDAQRQADIDGQGRRGILVGLSYVHRQLKPLRLVDLDGDGEKSGGGCGTLFDGMDGLCDV